MKYWLSLVRSLRRCRGCVLSVEALENLIAFFPATRRWMDVESTGSGGEVQRVK